VLKVFMDLLPEMIEISRQFSDNADDVMIRPRRKTS
jgi:hypothetical protein